MKTSISMKSPSSKEVLLNAFHQLLVETHHVLNLEGIKGKKQLGGILPLLVLKLLAELKAKGRSFPRLKKLKSFEWTAFANLDPPSMLKTVNRWMPALKKAYPRHTDFFSKPSYIKRPETLKRLIDRFSAFSLSEVNSDILGDTYEYFLHQSALDKKAILGMYFTPRPLVDLILDLVELKPNDTVYDPSCGSGGFLIQAFKRQPRLKRLVGREISDSIQIARLNLLLLGADVSELSQMDTLKVPIQGQCSVVLANFPFSQKTPYNSLYGLKGKDANPVFLKHIMDALMPGGVAAVVVPDRVLFHEASEYSQIRQALLETCQILGLIQLNEAVFMPYTKQPTQVLIFRKGGRTQNVWFFDLSGRSVKKTNLKRNPFPTEDLALLKMLWKNKADSPRSFSVNAQCILQANYYLSMHRYQLLKPLFKNSARLGDLCHIRAGETPPRHLRFYGGQHLFVGIEDLKQGVIKTTKRTVTDAWREQGKKPFKRHTLLLSIKFVMGRVALAGKRVYLSEAIAALIPKSPRVLVHYLYYVLPYLDYSPYLHRTVRGGELNKALLGVMQIPLPSLSLQRQFIHRLRTQEIKRQAHLKQAEKLLFLKQKTVQGLIERFSP